MSVMVHRAHWGSNKPIFEVICFVKALCRLSVCGEYFMNDVKYPTYSSMALHIEKTRDDAM